MAPTVWNQIEIAHFIWEAAKNHLEKIVSTIATRNIDLVCDNEECQKSYTSPLLFEQSSFFG